MPAWWSRGARLLVATGEPAGDDPLLCCTSTPFPSEWADRRRYGLHFHGNNGQSAVWQSGRLADQGVAESRTEIGRFKGLGEMMPAQLKETTMDPRKRTLLRVKLTEADDKATKRSVERLMGNKPEARFAFIQEKAEFASEDLLDV